MKFRKKHNSSASGVTPVIKSQAGDIVKIGTDAIVNAANSNLAAGGGVCGAIFSAAGHKQLQTACTKIGRCEVGSAVVTPAFGLESVGTRHILHAVGPIWGKSSPEECDRLLVSAYRSSLMLAQSLGASSIAIPAISTGIYHFPAERAAELVAKLLTTEVFELDEIVLLTLEPEKAAIYARALQAAQKANKKIH